eukprot:9067136-Lingulodinium_polyedra.AAC.1
MSPPTPRRNSTSRLATSATKPYVYPLGSRSTLSSSSIGTPNRGPRHGRRNGLSHPLSLGRLGHFPDSEPRHSLGTASGTWTATSAKR